MDDAGRGRDKASVGEVGSGTLSVEEPTCRVPQFTCPYCQRLYVSLTCFRKHLAAHAPSNHPSTSFAPNSSSAKPLPNDERSTVTTATSSNTADFCDLFTEEVSGLLLISHFVLRNGSFQLF